MNPTGQPFGTSTPPNTGNAQEAVNVPAILMAVTAVLAILTILGLQALSALRGGNEAQLQQMLSDPNIPEWLKSYARMSNQAGASRYLFPVIQVAVNGFIIFASLQMRNLKTWGVALTAGILSVIPCCFSSACCFVAIPAGIWVLVVLSRPEVKSAFTS